VATTLAVSGSLFAWMLSVDVTLGYLQTFAIMLLLAAASVVVARRV